MNKDQVAGRAQEAKGNLKEGAGKVLGNEQMEAEGKADQVGGKVQKNVGDAKEKTKDVVNKGIDKL